MSFLSTDWRNRRNIFGPTHYSMTNYCTNRQEKTEMRNMFGEEIFLNNLHLIPDPLKKNLADTLLNQDKITTDQANKDIQPAVPNESPLAGISNFFSGILNVMSGAMFRRTKETVNCFESNGALENWQDANSEIKNGVNQSFESSCSNVGCNNMSNCKTAAANCEDKLNRVRQLLTSQNCQNPPKLRQRRPKWVFVDPNYVDDCFEDAFSPEDFVNLANDTLIDYFSPVQYQNQEYFEVESPKMRLETQVSDFIEDIPKYPVVTEQYEKRGENLPENEFKTELVASCEEKLMKLKQLLQNRTKNNTKTILNMENCEEIVKPLKPTKSIPISKAKDKRFKNLHRLPSDKRYKSKLRQSIQEDMLFANEVNLEDLSSVENSPSYHSLESISENLPLSNETPKEYFDEISGRFRMASTTSSEDSFQIVFNDIPKSFRSTSDCDSEDSFIVFEDSPDSCYTSNDVFGDSDSECSGNDSDCSDSGCSNLQMSHKLSMTVSDLTDERLYDEVDCAKVLPNHDVKADTSKFDSKKDNPVKKVRFSIQPPKVHVMRVWAFAARQARPGPWERYALDRERFKRRIADVDVAVSWVLKPQHRSRVMFQRFMPWWNAQKRREIADKKREENEKLRGMQQLVEENTETTQEGCEFSIKNAILRSDSEKLQSTSNEIVNYVEIKLNNTQVNKTCLENENDNRENFRRDTPQEMKATTELENAESCIKHEILRSDADKLQGRTSEEAVNNTTIESINTQDNNKCLRIESDSGETLSNDMENFTQSATVCNYGIKSEINTLVNKPLNKENEESLRNKAEMLCLNLKAESVAFVNERTYECKNSDLNLEQNINSVNTAYKNETAKIHEANAKKLLGTEKVNGGKVATNTNKQGVQEVMLSSANVNEELCDTKKCDNEFSNQKSDEIIGNLQIITDMDVKKDTAHM